MKCFKRDRSWLLRQVEYLAYAFFANVRIETPDPEFDRLWNVGAQANEDLREYCQKVHAEMQANNNNKK